MKTPEELYAKLDKEIDSFTNESISREAFLNTINDLNKNDFGIKIDPNLVPYNRESFNENGIVSYWEDDETSY
jgi:hypothetical protein